MKYIKKYFDDFTFYARVMPAVTAGMPLIAWGLYNGIIKSDWWKAGGYFIISIILVSFAAYIARELGKRYEEKMYKELGGMPTTIIFRFSDNTIDAVSKTKYHRWINSKLSDISLPVSHIEESKDLLADEKYINAMRFLRTYANSNREKLPRVYQDLKKYNFWRNLYGCKRFCVVIYLIVILREFVCISGFSLRKMIFDPFPEYVILIGMIFWLMIFCMSVTKKTMKRNAFDYAKTLLETIDILEIEEIG